MYNVTANGSIKYRCGQKRDRIGARLNYRLKPGPPSVHPKSKEHGKCNLFGRKSFCPIPAGSHTVVCYQRSFSILGESRHQGLVRSECNAECRISLGVQEYRFGDILSRTRLPPIFITSNGLRPSFCSPPITTGSPSLIRTNSKQTNKTKGWNLDLNDHGLDSTRYKNLPTFCPEASATRDQAVQICTVQTSITYHRA